jgi:light-regulated signal transduction histidine kinase (bacteriophytochrome)
MAVLTGVASQVLARKELERVNGELEEFAYVASHDLQEPLRMVNIYTQLLVRRHVQADEEAKLFTDRISQGTARMEELINDLLAYSRTVQPDELPISRAALSESLQDALSVLKSSIEEWPARTRQSPASSNISIELCPKKFTFLQGVVLDKDAAQGLSR